jgi:membrane protein
MDEPVRQNRITITWRAARAALSRIAGGGGDFVRRVYHKAGDDDIFFLAGGIAFNVLLAAIPFVLLLIAAFGWIMKAVVADPEQAAVDYILDILPPSEQLVALTRRLVGEVVAGRTQFGLVGLALFLWTSTRFFGSLRSVLKSIFDLPEERGIVEGKIFDGVMVLVAGTLFLLNTGITIVVEAAQAFGVELLGVAGRAETEMLQRMLARLLAFAFIFLMFVLIYRFLPLRRIPWRMALVGAVFTAVVWELMKGGFAWYVSTVANYRTTYGALATLILLVFWAYYSSVIFIVGGEVAYVYDLLRRRRRQRELLE